MPRSILITGAAGGVGRALVARAQARGDTVFAAARRIDQLAQLAMSPSTIPIAMDFADDDAVTKGFAAIDDALGGRALDAVVHAAAIAPHAAVELTTAAMFNTVLNVNATGTLRVLHAALPRLRRSQGRCVLVSSLWSRTGGPLLASYAASKHAIGALADAARRETRGQGVAISVIELGVVATAMLEQQQSEIADLAALGRYAALYQAYRSLTLASAKTALTADAAAAGIERALTAPHPKARYRVGTDAKAVALLTRILSDRMLDAAFAALMKPKAE